MPKDFQKWHMLKSQLEKTEHIHLFNEKDIWWCSVGENVGFEGDGKNNMYERPVLILKKYNSEVFFGAPLTTSQKPHPLRYPYKINDTEGTINLTQCRTWSARRLLRRMGRMSNHEASEVYKLIAADLLEKAKPPLSQGNLERHNGEMYK